MTRAGIAGHVRGSMSILAVDPAVPTKTVSGAVVTEAAIDELADIPPGRLSIDPNSEDFHPSYVRVGVRVDGKERNDLQFYDVARLEIMTTAKTSHLCTSIEPYWRYPESRQQRRARERWEAKRIKR